MDYSQFNSGDLVSYETHNIKDNKKYLKFAVVLGQCEWGRWSKKEPALSCGVPYIDSSKGTWRYKQIKKLVNGIYVKRIFLRKNTTVKKINIDEVINYYSTEINPWINPYALEPILLSLISNLCVNDYDLKYFKEIK